MTISATVAQSVHLSVPMPTGDLELAAFCGMTPHLSWIDRICLSSFAGWFAESAASACNSDNRNQSSAQADFFRHGSRL